MLTCSYTHTHSHAYLYLIGLYCHVSGKEIQALMQKQTGGKGGGDLSSEEEEASLSTEDRPPKQATLAPATSGTPSSRPTTPSKTHTKSK